MKLFNIDRTEPWKTHDPFQTGDPEAPEQIKDRNGEVVLACCRRCGRAEIELSELCPEWVFDRTQSV